MTNKWGTVKLFTFSFGIDPPNIISCGPKIFSCAPKNLHLISNFLSSDLQMDHGFLTGQSWCVHKTCHIAAGFQQAHGGQQNSLAISHQLATYFSLEINPVFTNEMRNVSHRTQTLVKKPKSCLNYELLSLFNHQSQTLYWAALHPKPRGLGAKAAKLVRKFPCVLWC